MAQRRDDYARSLMVQTNNRLLSAQRTLLEAMSHIDTAGNPADEAWRVEAELNRALRHVERWKELAHVEELPQEGA